MRKFETLLVALAILPCGLASAQTPEEIETAREVARKYGYSEKDIDAVLGHQAVNTATLEPDKVEVVQSTTTKPEVVVLPTAAVAATGTSGIYGHDYFISPGVGTITSYTAPAPSSYILGPGDEVVVDIWGATVSHVEATIQNNGSINLQDLGPVYLAGMSLEKAESALKSQLSRIYAGLSDERGDTFVRLSVGKMRGIIVNISGEITTPGAYTIPSLATLPSAIYTAGGIKPTGSVRCIALYRKGKKVAVFDLYEYLFNGQMDENLRLQDGDVINVEPHKNLASINGSVLRSMSYEFKDGETIMDLVRFAGGFTTGAQKSEVHISRKDVGGTKAFEIQADGFNQFKLQDGDAITVRSYQGFNENSISLMGPVKVPGTYALGGDITDVASLVKAASGLIEGAFTGYGQINRLDKNRQPEYLTFDLEDVLTGQRKIELQREDQVIIYSHDDFVASQSVMISGAVNKPGLYSFHTGMKLSELIAEAGGLRGGAYLARGIISHESQNGQPVTAPFNVSEAASVTLMRSDAVHIYGTGDLKQEATVSILGEVNAPGAFAYREGLTIGDLIGFAMGFTDGVDMTNAQLTSRGGRERGKVETLNFEQNPDLMNRLLRPYDVISFRRLTYFREMIRVSVNGEVMSPGNYVIDKPEVRISDVMARTGGFTEEAYPHGAKLIRVLTQEERDRQMTAVMIANQNLGEKTEINVATLTDRYTIGIDIEKAIANPGSVSDVILRSGDILEIPQMNNTVKVSGGVFYPNTVAFDESLRWKDYVNQAGGFAKHVRRGKTYAIYMNGKVAAGRSKIYTEPGMEIVVPEKKESERQKLSPVEIASLTTSATSITTLVATLVSLFLK